MQTSKGFVSFLLVIMLLPTIIEIGSIKQKTRKETLEIKKTLLEQQKITNIENDIETTFWQAMKENKADKQQMKNWKEQQENAWETTKIDISGGKLLENGSIKKIRLEKYLREVPTKKQLEIKRSGETRDKEGLTAEIKSGETKSVYVIPEGNSIEY